MENSRDNLLVSIIVPVYNVEKYLDKCIRSLVEQTYKNIEIILVDDGSLDSCGQICDEWKQKDMRIRVFHKANGGQGSARNLALDTARGKYVSFVDSDDYIDADMIEVMLKDILRYQADLAICGIHINNSFRVVDSAIPGKKRIYQNPSELLKDYISTAWIFTGPVNKLYRIQLFEGIRFPEIRCNEDAYIMHEVLGRCKCAVHTNQCLYTQYLREDSTEKSLFAEKNMVLIECAERLRKYIVENFPELKLQVITKVSEDVIYLMKKIIYGHNIKINKMSYIKLEKKLREEIIFLKKECYSSTYIRKLQAFLKFQFLYLLIWIVKGYINSLKRLIKYKIVKIRK